MKSSNVHVYKTTIIMLYNCSMKCMLEVRCIQLINTSIHLIRKLCTLNVANIFQTFPNFTSYIKDNIQTALIFEQKITYIETIFGKTSVHRNKLMKWSEKKFIYCSLNFPSSIFSKLKIQSKLMHLMNKWREPFPIKSYS